MVDQHDAARRLHCEPCLNIRDVGGYLTTDGASIRWRTLLRGDNLCQLAPAGRASLMEYGLRTVIDLRHAWEVEEVAHPFGPAGPCAEGVRYHHIPLRHPDNAVLSEAVQAATDHLEVYRLTLDHSGQQIAAVMRAILDAPEGAVIVHCHVGKDRTGVVVALLLALAGVPNETIVADYALSDGYLRPLYVGRVAAGRPENDDEWRSDPSTMRRLLEHLDSVHGGARRYLLSVGLTAEEIDRLRARLRDDSGTGPVVPVSKPR